ncbi:sugar ABC transporter ATP-binding protein [Brucella endophytica]|uniref:Sugar ABC transporter ATP-binding protein n=1 Tax=Brucella endophytica TaxID=1963359 RepID=A0A916WMK4_9HYPH|nr:ABC transporter ATP-binding protein [Brucella endophytica]GGB12369.1 sugar ABC transporter ATP-binding protein [Brucella endophytica]
MSFDQVPMHIPSNEVAISVRNVSKKFRLFDNHGDRIKEALHPFRKAYHRDFWALNDISFDIRKGEIVGILGRNGSGKSTLLQIISGVMQPTKGKIETAGRISALLELGAGFNPEFTGRQNVILNGAIMGFSADEMKQRMPAVEAFADVGDFFDQPVKTYSSGMFVRVAFAAAINIDPDILIVDEALAVGDAKFQHKCYMHFKRFYASGKTILLVSHSTEAVLRNCDRAILVDGGHMVVQGKPQDVVDKYYEMLFPSNKNSGKYISANSVPVDGLSISMEHGVTGLMPGMTDGQCETRNSYNRNEFRFGDRKVEIVDYVISTEGSLYPAQIHSGEAVSLLVRLKVNDFSGLLSAGFAVKTVEGIKLFGANTISSGVALPPAGKGESIWVRFDFLMNAGAGEVFIDLGCGDWTTPPAIPLDRRHSIIHLVVSGDGRSDGLSNFFVKMSVPEASADAVLGKKEQALMM